MKRNVLAHRIQVDGYTVNPNEYSSFEEVEKEAKKLAIAYPGKKVTIFAEVGFVKVSITEPVVVRL